MMKKEIYIIRGSNNESYQHFFERNVSLLHNVARLPSVSACKCTCTTSSPPKISVIPFRKKKVAVLSVYHSGLELIDLLVASPGFAGAWLAHEAIPVSYSKTWDDLIPTPGVCLLTLFKKKRGISDETFIDRWHNNHTPLSLKIHPLWNYNRNVVKALSPAPSVPWDGVVEEQFRTKSDLLNPVRFFGHPLIMPYRMWQVYSDTQSFLDYRSIEPYFATELWIKSKSG